MLKIVVQKKSSLSMGFLYGENLGNEPPGGESEERRLQAVISRDPEQVERRALLGRREHFLGSISYIDTPYPRAALQPVFNLFIHRLHRDLKKSIRLFGGGPSAGL